MAPQASIEGPGEGQLNLVLWDGYAGKVVGRPVQPAATGCKVNQHPAGSSDEMVSLMKDGGGGNWDMVSASGDEDLRLIYSGDVKPMNTIDPGLDQLPDLLPISALQPRSWESTTASRFSGAPTHCFTTPKFVNPPTSWSVILRPGQQGV